MARNLTTGRSAFLALLKDEGITHLFGNPGTTELPVMDALKDHPEVTYVMAMQESLVVAMADETKHTSANTAYTRGARTTLGRPRQSTSSPKNESRLKGSSSVAARVARARAACPRSGAALR